MSIYNNICKLIGHQWRYKDYSNFMKSNGDKYDFSASRHCRRCYQHSYFYDEWKDQVKSPFDIEKDCNSVSKFDLESIILIQKTILEFR